LQRSLVAITGASSGIGEVFAQKLAPSYDLLLIARREERLLKLAEELKAATGSEVEILVADLSRDSDIDRVAQRLESDPRLVMLVNNAGFGVQGLFWQTALPDQMSMHQLHIMATMRLTYAALRNLVPRDFGAVINVASVAAYVRTAGNITYSATKTWMTAFTEGLYLELKKANSQVSVQALCPGYVISEFHDRLGIDRTRIASPSLWLTPEEVVDASLEGLRTRKLFVIPNWRYRLFTALVSRLPTPLRLQVETMGARMRDRGVPALAGEDRAKLPGGR
jgi:uncharacterized protein